MPGLDAMDAGSHGLEVRSDLADEILCSELVAGRGEGTAERAMLEAGQ